jgi:hypothetical protein
MIPLTHVRTLDLAIPTAPGRPRHLSAASGLVCVRSTAYVIADDELHLGVFRVDRAEPGSLIRLFDGVLPDRPGLRKKQKPDLEAIALLPASRDHPHGALAALGSGSTPQRRVGVVLALGRSGAVQGPPELVDLSPVYAPLQNAFESLNIEGAVVSAEDICLFQRDNATKSRNAVIRFRLDDFLHTLRAGDPGLRPTRIDDFDLGQIGNVPLSFTDGAALPDGRIVFTAAAEDTDNPYDDGRCAGSAIGIIEGGALQGMGRVDRLCKLEGVHARMIEGIVRLLLVSDADDADIPAEMFEAAVPDFSG